MFQNSSQTNIVIKLRLSCQNFKKCLLALKNIKLLFKNCFQIPLYQIKKNNYLKIEIQTLSIPTKSAYCLTDKKYCTYKILAVYFFILENIYKNDFQK